GALDVVRCFSWAKMQIGQRVREGGLDVGQILDLRTLRKIGVQTGEESGVRQGITRVQRRKGVSKVHSDDLGRSLVCRLEAVIEKGVVKTVAASFLTCRFRIGKLGNLPPRH